MRALSRNVAAFRVSADENIKVVKRGNPDGGRPVHVTIQTPDPASFNASKGRIAATLARAVGRVVPTKVPVSNLNHLSVA